jgi:hypothetical protein
VEVRNPSGRILAHPHFPIRRIPDEEEIRISHSNLSASFDPNGFLKALTRGGKEVPLRLRMHT